MVKTRCNEVKNDTNENEDKKFINNLYNNLYFRKYIFH